MVSSPLGYVGLPIAPIASTMPPKNDQTGRPLSEQINIATRSVHTKLNKLVIFRLPLAQPPQADDASQYVSGLLHVAPIYITFESLWRTLVESPVPVDFNAAEDTHSCTACEPQSKDDKAGTSDVHSKPSSVEEAHLAVVCPRIHSLLSHLRLDGLQRTQPLQRDLNALTGWSSRTLVEQLNDAAESPVLADFLTHTKRSVQTHPHVLLAYAWVLYMALFSGGRFIRASLESIDPSFWVPASMHPPVTVVGSPSPSPRMTIKAKNTMGESGSQPSAPLDFFHFDTPTDGEDLKQTFKRRLAESEALLTTQEKDDIVQEARCIFDFMVRLVGALDDVCGTDREAEAATSGSNSGSGGGFGVGLLNKLSLLSLRSRDSVVVEKERRLADLVRKGMAGSEESDNNRSSGSSAKSSDSSGKGKSDGEGGVRFR
ncbi:hypothetical protein F5Y15DRAFT_254459 [Xylariaceae sp. FL0016]|nr:hypothetical protein F5Y15DRAFT_254459 [Xylariaceae sp. FL0016]